MPSIARSLLLSLAALALAGCETVFFGALNHGGARRALHELPGIEYQHEQHLALDVFKPAQAAPGRPLVVFFYGGSWQFGDRAQYRFVGQALAARGIVALLPDYRHHPAATFDQIVADAASAAAWARAHAAELGADPARIYLSGHSAGAHLAALLATDARWLAPHGLKPRDFAGVVGVAGPYDFLPLTDAKLIELFGPPEHYAATQPVNFVDGDEPPFLLLHGARDHTVRPHNSTSLAARLEALHEPATLRMYPGIGHTRILMSLSDSYARVAPALDDLCAFVGCL